MYKQRHRHPNYKKTPKCNYAHIGYIATRPGTVKNEEMRHGLYGSLAPGNLTEFETWQEAARLVRELSCRRINMFRSIISFSPETAAELGLLDHAAWEDYIERHIYDDADYDYEMLSGHNRMNAGVLAGLTGAWCVVKENLSDTEARMYVIETNLMQRSFTDLLPSEKAAVLALRYSEMFSQGKRNDIIRELRLLENPDAEDIATCGTEFHKSASRESLGKEYSLTGRAVAGYLRIDKLAEGLKLRLDQDGMTIKAGIALSFLNEESQSAVETALLTYKGKLSEHQGQLLREAVAADGLTAAMAFNILNGVHSKPAASLRIKQAVYAPYFQADTPPKEIERIVGEALKLYFSQSSVGESA